MTWLFFDLLSVFIYLFNSSLTDKIKYFFSSIYLKNRANLGFLFLGGYTVLGSIFNSLFLGNSRIKLHHKLNLFNHLDFIFDDFYSNFKILVVKMPSKIVFDLNFFASNVFVNKLLTANYWNYNYEHWSLFLIRVNYVDFVMAVLVRLLVLNYIV